MQSKEFVEKLIDAAKNHKTLYIMGCFGAPMNDKNKKRYSKNHSYNRKPERTAMIQAAGADVFGFDCVCLIKGILWGWNADKNKTYGGAAYKSNDVPDIGADQMFNACTEQSSDFNKILPGEAVWMSGHIGVYIGGGLAVECSPKWENKVQITACNCSIAGYNRRNWKKHGKLPYIEYEEVAPVQQKEKAPEGFQKGDLVKIIGEKYYSGKVIPAWVKAKRWYVCSVRKNRVVIDKSEDGKNSICSPVNANDLEHVGQNER